MKKMTEIVRLGERWENPSNMEETHLKYKKRLLSNEEIYQANTRQKSG